MSILIIDQPMLYCPKCESNYEDGLQRFCLNDGARLLPAEPESGKPKKATTHVFSSILGKVSSENGESAATSGRRANKPNFSLPVESKIFKRESESNTSNVAPDSEAILNLENDIQNEVSPETMSIDSRIEISNEAFITNSDDPQKLLGQTIKDRFYIVEIIGQNENGSVYLAEDTDVSDKKVIVRVSPENALTEATGDLVKRKASLLNINHPNVAGIIDAGELNKGKTFIVSEYVEGQSLAEVLAQSGQLNVQRASRLVRQISDALDAVHRTVGLYLNLSPDDVILTNSGEDEEQIKLINFGDLARNKSGNNPAFIAPEQLGGESPSVAGEVYSLASLTYLMLTAQLPFSADTEAEMLKAQREGFKLLPTNMRLDLPAAVDDVLSRGLAFDPANRYARTTDFSEAFDSAVNEENTQENVSPNDDGFLLEIGNLDLDKKPDLPPIDLAATVLTFDDPIDEKADLPVLDKPKPAASRTISIEDVKATQDLAWERRSIEAPQNSGWALTVFSVIGVLLLLGGLWGIWYYFLNHPSSAEMSAAASVESAPPIEPSATINENVNAAQAANPMSKDIEVPPLPRDISQPPNTVYFENSRENLDKNLLRHYRGFSLYYPKDWKKNKAENKFIDISKDASSGTPIEQLLVSYYPSGGTYSKDADKFSNLVKESNEDLKKILPNFKVISEGETVVNNGWRAYQVKFTGEGKTVNGEKITLWGRRLFIPAARPGVQTGYVITLLATSLSKDVKSIEDVGTKGDLASILYTFEPDQNS